MRTGVVASVVANVHRVRRSRTFKPEDFVPEWMSPSGSSSKEQSVVEMRSELEKLYAWATKNKMLKNGGVGG